MNDSLVFDFNRIRRRRPLNLLVDGTILGVNMMEVMAHLGTADDPNLLEDIYEIPVHVEEPVDYEDGKYNATKISNWFSNWILLVLEDAPPPVIQEEEEEEEEEEKSGSSMDYESPANHHTVTFDERTILRTIQIKVVLEDQTLIDLFTIIMTLMIVLNTVNMGGQLDLEIIKAVFKKPIGPIVGFVSQFILMPLVRQKIVPFIAGHLRPWNHVNQSLWYMRKRG